MNAPADLPPVDMHGPKQELEHAIVRRLLRQFRGDVRAAARAIGVSPKTLWEYAYPTVHYVEWPGWGDWDVRTIDSPDGPGGAPGSE